MRLRLDITSGRKEEWRIFMAVGVSGERIVKRGDQSGESSGCVMVAEREDI